MERSFLAVGDKRKEREDLGLAAEARMYQPMFSSYKSQTSMGMGVPIRMFPFTAAQWQELQRQALIYKHFMASVPVPPDLIFPSASKSFPETPAFLLPSTVMGRSGVSLRFQGGIDPEPGRCRRTDGKKWRCAKDAAPDQKYCERHLHRSRPRSRKPVELNKTAKLKSSAAADSVGNGGNSGVETTTTRMALPNIELNAPFRSMDSNEQPRRQDWMKNYPEDLASNQQQWEPMHSKIGFKYNSDPVLQTYGHLPNLNYTNDANEDCCSFLNPDLSCLEGSHHLTDYKEPQRGLIDAWSSDDLVSTSKPIESSTSDRDKLPFSCLTLSMSNGIDERADNSPLGGPLAEAFQPTNSNNNCIDLINFVSNSCSSSGSRLVSSPSGVLQKSLVSSDCSSSSSPTFAAVPQSEFAFEWMKQNK